MIYSSLFTHEDTTKAVIALPVNWDDPYTLAYEFKTDIITAEKGYEQRRAVRFRPRMEISYTTQYQGEAKRTVDGFLAMRQAATTFMPEWSRSVVLTEDLQRTYTEDGEIKDDGLTVSMERIDIVNDKWINSGDTVILVCPWYAETRVVASVKETSFDFVEASDTLFPAHLTRVYRAVEGHIDLRPSSPRLTKSVATLKVSFRVSPDSTIIHAPEEGYAFPVQGYRHFFDLRPNWAEDVDVTFDAPRQEVDYGFGAVSHHNPIEFSSRETKASYVLRGRKEVAQMVQFFASMRGRARSFLLPTWEDDLAFYAIAGNGRAILIRGTGFAHLYERNTVYRRIMIRLRNGAETEIHRIVDYIEPLPDTDSSVIWLTEALPPEQFTAKNIIGIHWVLATRFASDRLEIEYLTSETAQFAPTFRSLENYEL